MSCFIFYLKMLITYLFYGSYDRNVTKCLKRNWNYDKIQILYNRDYCNYLVWDNCSKSFQVNYKSYNI